MAVPAELEAAPGTRRLAWSALGVAAAAVLFTARQLQPDARGFGTHTQLGLPPCLFQTLTGLPCPTCGLTTSFAYMARWQITSAFAAHPFGPLLFALTALALLCAVHGGVSGTHMGATCERLRIRALAVIIAIAMAAIWLVQTIVLLSK